MRRTYKSKKAADGTILQNTAFLPLENKESMFDALFIKNIKETKRELSCMGASAQYLLPPKPFRKKLVKKKTKIFNEHSSKSPLESLYLTPNKSLHVKKTPDIFDQLLESLSPMKAECIQNSKSSLLSSSTHLRHKKVYKRKNKLKPIKFKKNFSNESDKENCNESADTTDYGNHELLIETNYKRENNSTENINNVLTKMNSPIMCQENNYVKEVDIVNRSSILCSTPITYKHRGKSLFLKMSPIQSNKNIIKDQNPENDKSIKNEDQCNTSNLSKKGDNDCKNESPMTTPNATKIVSNQSKTVSPNSINIVSPNTHQSVSSDKFINFVKKHHNSSETVLLSNRETTKASTVQENECSDHSGHSNQDLDILQLQGTPPSQLFLGFTNINNDQSNHHLVPVDQFFNSIKENNKSTVADLIDCVLNNSDAEEPIRQIPQDFTFHENECSEYSVHSKQDFDVSLFQSTPPSQLFLGFSQKKIDCSSLVGNKTCSFNISNTDGLENIREASLDDCSWYDTCNSKQSINTNSMFLNTPIVKLEKLNESLYQKYKKALNDSSLSSNSLKNRNSSSTKHYLNCNSLVENDMTYDNSDSKYQSKTEITISSDEYLDTDSENEKDQVDFVTTRRKIKNTNSNQDDSFFLHSDVATDNASQRDSPIIFSKNTETPNETIESVDDRLHDNTNEKSLNKLEQTTFDERKYSESLIMKTDELSPRKTCNPINLRDTIIYNNEGDQILKSGIRLKPGKKWERSLSIYRRMTMCTDNFEPSRFEDESLFDKSKQLRQSTMNVGDEFQSERGSLYNSFHRPKIQGPAKPFRSTIKIIKDLDSTSRVSLCSTTYDELRGFLSDDCDDTVLELSKLSIGDSEHEITVLEKVHDTSTRSDLVTPQEYVLRRCNQTSPILFDECYPDAVLKNCHKIGEGVYGEVFLWRANDGRARVMKIVPVAGALRVNGEPQKTYHEIISEIVIAMELSALRTHIADVENYFDEGKDTNALDLYSITNATDVFNEVVAVRCVYGNYPARLLELWDLYDECKGSENDNPSLLPSDQQYIVLELANAGLDIESYQFVNAEQAHAVLIQVAFGLAVGEEAFQFEHRDLHWGNVLVAPTDQKYATFVLRGRWHRVLRCGVAATIIDYSLSRLTLGGAGAGGGGAALYNDLADDAGLFDAVGDHQFEVYRLMRDKLGNNWQTFDPYTNVLWLHYMVDKMITALRYKRTNTKTHRHYLSKLKAIKNRILDYPSATELVLTDDF